MGQRNPSRTRAGGAPDTASRASHASHVSGHDVNDGNGASEDVVFVHGRSEDGKTLAVLRKRGDEVSAGLLRRAEEGKPVHGELLRLAPREDAPMLCDVEVLHDPSREREAGAATRSGPAQVATPAFRAGWDALFGARAPRRTPAAELN